MLLAWLSAVVCLVLLVGTVTGWYWLEVYHQSAESRIESQARRTAQALILPSGLAISAAAGVVVVSRVGARGTGVRLVQGEFTYTLPESVLLGAAEFLAAGGLVGLSLAVLACGLGALSRSVAA
jgi:hypothetical protein